MELGVLKKHELEALRAEILAELKRRYKKSCGMPKYGGLNKGLLPSEFALVLSFVRHPKARLAFVYQRFLGLRIGEACRVRTPDLDLGQRRLWVQSAKGSVPTSFYLHDEVYAETLAYLRLGLHDEEWLLPAEHRSHGRLPHISPDWARNYYRGAVDAAGLTMVYGMSEERTSKPPRRLLRVSTHSNRYLFITQVYKTTHDLLLTQRLARHRSVKNTQGYVFLDQEEIDRALVGTFARETI